MGKAMIGQKKGRVITQYNWWKRLWIVKKINLRQIRMEPSKQVRMHVWNLLITANDEREKKRESEHCNVHTNSEHMQCIVRWQWRLAQRNDNSISWCAEFITATQTDVRLQRLEDGLGHQLITATSSQHNACMHCVVLRIFSQTFSKTTFTNCCSGFLFTPYSIIVMKLVLCTI